MVGNFLDVFNRILLLMEQLNLNIIFDVIKLPALLLGGQLLFKLEIPLVYAFIPSKISLLQGTVGTLPARNHLRIYAQLKDAQTNVTEMEYV